jgi:hypothetical protein
MSSELMAQPNAANKHLCLCNAGWAGVAANGCVECAAGSFSPVNGSAACQVCRNNSDTFMYPRTVCQCRKGFFGIGTSPCIECPQHTWAHTGLKSKVGLAAAFSSPSFFHTISPPPRSLVRYGQPSPHSPGHTLLQ